MRRPRILVVGSFVMDLIVRSEHFVQAGETIIGRDFHTASGGKGANQAVQAARLGAEVTMIGKVGDDAYGREMLQSLAAANVNIDGVKIDPGCCSAIGNVQIQENNQGTQNRIVVVPGANMRLTVEELAPLERTIDYFDMLLLQLEIPMAVNDVAARFAHVAHVPVMLNPAPYAPLPAGLMEHIDYLSPNETEAAGLAGFAVQTDDDCRHAFASIGCPRLLITRGRAGSAYGDGRQILFSPCAPCPGAVDPTAAGDSYVAAFCVAICCGLEPREAMTFAGYTAALTVSAMGAQPSLPTLAQVQEHMHRSGLDLTPFAPVFKGGK